MSVPFGAAAGQLQSDQLKDFVLINYDWFGDSSKVLFKIIEDITLLDYEVCSDLKLLSAGKQILAYVFKLESGKWTALVLVKCGTKLLCCTFGDNEQVNEAKAGVLSAVDIIDSHHFLYDAASVSATDSGIIALESVHLICCKLEEVHKHTNEIEKALATFGKPPKEETTVDRKIKECHYHEIEINGLRNYKIGAGCDKTFLLDLGGSFVPILVKTSATGRLIAVYLEPHCMPDSRMSAQSSEEIKEILRDKNIAHHSFHVQRQLTRWDAFQAANIINTKLAKGKLPCIVDLEGEIKKLGFGKRQERLCDVFWEALGIKTEIIEKLKHCLKQVTDRLPSSATFSHSDANLFVHFVEVVAMQGLRISNKYRKSSIVKNYLDKIRANIVGDGNWKVVKEIRNQYLFHRTFLQTLSPEDIEQFITESGQTVNKFFERAKQFLENTISNIEELHTQYKYNDSQSRSLGLSVSSKIQQWQDQQFDADGAKSALMHLFKSFMRHAYENGDGPEEAFCLDEQLYQYTVNLVPLLGNFFPGGCDESGTSGRGGGGKDKLAHDLEELRILRNNIVHGVFESSETRLQELLSAICRSRVVFSKFYYSQELFKVFLKINEGKMPWDSARNLFENTLNELQLSFGKEYCSSEEFLKSERNFGYVVAEWVHLKVDDLQNYFEQHFDLLALLQYLEPVHPKGTTARQKRELLELCGHWMQKAKMLGPGEMVTLIEEIKNADLSETIRLQVVSKITETDLSELVLKFGGGGSASNAQIHIRNTLLMIQQILRYYDVSNGELIHKFSNRFRSVDTDPVAERLRCIPVADPLYVTTMQEPDFVPRAIELDSIVTSLLGMCNDSFLRYKLEFTNVNVIFQDRAILAYLVDQFLNNSADLDHVTRALQDGPPFLYPLLVKMITSKCKLLDMEIDSLLKIARRLFTSATEFSMKFLIEILNAENEDLIKVLNANSASTSTSRDIRGSIIETLCEELCQDQDQGAGVHQKSLNLLFQQNLLPFLHALMKKFKSVSMGDESERRILRRVVESINEVYFERYKSDQQKEKSEQSRSILVEALQLVYDSNVLNRTEPAILSARRILAKFHLRLGEKRLAQDLCIETHTSLQPVFARRPSGQDLDDDTTLKKYGGYLLNFSDIAYTFNLLEDNRAAYQWFRDLYCELMGSGETNDEITFTTEMYERLSTSEVYKKLSSLSQKYLNVLRVVTDAIYEKNILARKNGDLQDHLKVLDIYSRVHAIRVSELGSEHVDTTTVLRAAQYTEHCIGFLYQQAKDFETARDYYERSLEKVRTVKEIQRRRFGEFHQAVRKANQFESRSMQYLAECLNEIGMTALRQRDDQRQALECFRMAMNNYERSYEFQLQEFGKGHKFTEIVASRMSYTRGLLTKAQA